MSRCACACVLFHNSMRVQGVYINRVDNVDDQFEAVENDLQVGTPYHSPDISQSFYEAMHPEHTCLHTWHLPPILP